jgi:hypothetical protein
MEYQLVLPSEIDLSPSEIVQAWNEDQQASALGEAHVTTVPTKQFDPTLIVAGVVALVSSVGTGLLTNALYDVLKAALLRKVETPHMTHRHLKIHQMQLPDMTSLLVVELDEEEK